MRTPTGGRARTGALAITLASSALLLAGCIEPPVEASGSGVVTISWAGAADSFDGTYGDLLGICAPSAQQCGPDAPGSLLYLYDPAEASTSATLSPGSSVRAAGGGATELPTGTFTLQALAYAPLNLGGGLVVSPVGRLLSITIGSTGTKDLTTWLQSVARPSAEARCARGYTPSWDAWPNDGAGGFVCNRTVYAYYPDEPVRGPGWDSAAPEWRWSVERAGVDAPCPEGFDPSWAQWPRDGAGGYVCVGLAE